MFADRNSPMVISESAAAAALRPALDFVAHAGKAWDGSLDQDILVEIWDAAGRPATLASFATAFITETQRLMARRSYFAVAHIPDGTARVVEMRGPAFPAPGGWTLQQVEGFGGTILGEFDSLAGAQRAVDEWVS